MDGDMGDDDMEHDDLEHDDMEDDIKFSFKLKNTFKNVFSLKLNFTMQLCELPYIYPCTESNHKHKELHCAFETCG